MFAQFAMKYLESGYSVMPTSGKFPFKEFEGYQRYSEKLPLIEEIERWSKGYEKANISLLCGKASNIIAFDYDYQLNDTQQVENIILGLLPPTPIVKTGKKGWTRFYKYNGLPSTKKDRNGDRMFDFLSDGKYTVLPPSIHPETLQPYKWSSIDTLLDINQLDLPVIEQHILDKIISLADMDLINGKIPFKIGAGRHDRVIAYGWGIIESCNSKEECIEKLIEYDKTKLDGLSYLTDRKYFRTTDIRKNAEAIYKKLEKTVITSKKKRGIDWKIGEEPEISIDIKSVKDFIKAQDNNGFYNEKTNSDGSTSFVPDYQAFGNLSKMSKLFLLNDAYSLIYDDNYWKFKPENYIKNVIMNCNKQHWKPQHFNNFLTSIRVCCDESEFEFKSTERKLNLNNGILDLNTNTMEEHSNKYLFKYKIPIKYDQSATCDKWLTFLKDTFSDDQELINLAQDIFGYTILGGEPFLHRIFILYGNGRNGKSTFLDILKYLIGKENYSTVGMANIQKPFSAVMLDGKLANIVGETAINNISNEAVKAIAAGEEIIVSKKNQDEYKLKPEARLIFACNKYPDFKDNSVGILDRIVFLPFDKYLTEEKRDTDLVSKLKIEISGILNWTIEGSKRILETKKIQSAKRSNEVKEDYKKASDSLYAWFDDNIIFTGVEIDKIFTDDLFSNYLLWCNKSNRMHSYTVQNFSLELSRILKTKSNGQSFEAKRIYIGTSRLRGFVGVKVVSDSISIASAYNLAKRDGLSSVP